MIRQYQFFCSNCGYKRLTDGTDIQDLIPVKLSPVSTGAPFVDPLTKKIAVTPNKNQKKMFKCPKCGYSIFAKKIS